MLLMRNDEKRKYRKQGGEEDDDGQLKAEGWMQKAETGIVRKTLGEGTGNREEAQTHRQVTNSEWLGMKG
jgi:hypothetical protein